jgi:hypothetical protein
MRNVAFGSASKCAILTKECEQVSTVNTTTNNNTAPNTHENSLNALMALHNNTPERKCATKSKFLSSVTPAGSGVSVSA